MIKLKIPSDFVREKKVLRKGTIRNLGKAVRLKGYHNELERRRDKQDDNAHLQRLIIQHKVKNGLTVFTVPKQH